MGAPTKFDERFIDQAYVACYEGGFTDLKLAKLFKVDKSTINNWKHVYPDFFDSIKKGKDEFNVEVAEKALLKRVKGFNYTEVTREPAVILNKKDTDISGLKEHVPVVKMVITKKVRKHIASDPTSTIFFLKNRDPQRWRDKREVEVTGAESLVKRLQDAEKRMNDRRDEDDG